MMNEMTNSYVLMNEQIHDVTNNYVPLNKQMHEVTNRFVLIYEVTNSCVLKKLSKLMLSATLLPGT